MAAAAAAVEQSRQQYVAAILAKRFKEHLSLAALFRLLTR